MMFPQTLVINLEERKDRLREFTHEFNKWPVPIHRIEAVKKEIPAQGCTLSHKKAIEYARDHNFPWVLILEDDCLLEEDAIEQFTFLLPFLWSLRPEWDIFLGGTANILTKENKMIHHEKNIKKKKPDIQVISKDLPLLQIKAYTAMFCLIHKDSYSKILSDIGGENTKVLIDVLYATHYRLWCTYPQLIRSTYGKSTIQNTYTAYSPAFKKASTFLRKALEEQK